MNCNTHDYPLSFVNTLQKLIQNDDLLSQKIETLSHSIGNHNNELLLTNSCEKACIVFDHNEIATKISSLKGAFPQNTVHCFAVKSNPLTSILKMFYVDFNMSFECASMGEVQQIMKVMRLCHLKEDEIKLQLRKKRIVFDSPCKSIEDLLYCMRKGIYFNIDNFEELRKVITFLNDTKKNLNCKEDDSIAQFGLRINPEVGAGSNVLASTAMTECKFGILLNEILFDFKGFIELIQKTKGCLKGLHCHVGSAGMKMKQCVNGVRKILELAERINKIVKNQIQVIDIGGGLPVLTDWKDKKEIAQMKEITFEKYWKELKDLKLNIENYQIITEFGRCLISQAGYFISRIEYIKNRNSFDMENKTKTLMRQHAIIHVGADFFCRVAYSGHAKEKWLFYEILLSSDGKKILSKRDETKRILDISGPLCFSGDTIIKGAPSCVDLKVDDIVVIPNSGAYTISAFSLYCSREWPSMYCYKNGRLVVLRKKNSVKEWIKIWD